MIILKLFSIFVLIFLAYACFLLMHGFGVFMVSEFIPAMANWDMQKWLAFSVLCSVFGSGFYLVFLRSD